MTPPVQSRWSLKRARDWWDRQPWLVGCNFTPSTAINQLELWQEPTFDLARMDRELGWAADLGFNVVRVYLHDLVWRDDADGFIERIEAFLAVAHRHGIRAIPVFFDDVWGPEPKAGKQPAPHPGRHNSGWVQSPGRAALDAYPSDPAVHNRLEQYVSGVISRFSEDERIAIWDLYNEPGGYPFPGAEPMGELGLPLLRDVFDWARSASPTQPLTSGLWSTPLHPASPAIRACQLEHSDIVSFHHYGSAADLERLCDGLALETERPLLCSEYLARKLESRFETHLPIFRKRQIGAISWGLVSGKTQTIYPWWSWFDKEPKPEPQVWFHDILRADGTPFDPAEADFLRSFLTSGEP